MGLKRTLCDDKNSEHSYTGSGTWNYWLTLTAGCEENQQVHSFPLEEIPYMDGPKEMRQP